MSGEPSIEFGDLKVPLRLHIADASICVKKWRQCRPLECRRNGTVLDGSDLWLQTRNLESPTGLDTPGQPRSDP